jgi:hypothetical protein
MNQDIKAGWGEWLLANAGKQGGGALHRAGAAPDGSDDTFCCLGGLCELGAAAGIVRRELIPGSRLYQYTSVTDATDVSTVRLPRAIVEWAELPSVNPLTSSGYTLTVMNDNTIPFPVIWDRINAAF